VLSRPLNVHYLQHYQAGLGRLLQGVFEQIHMVERYAGHMLAEKDSV